jgi:hypothetical protein
MRLVSTNLKNYVALVMERSILIGGLESTARELVIGL